MFTLSPSETWFLSHPWAPALLWAILYPSDYYLRLWVGRLHKRQSVIQWEGSYELTPAFQDDVDNQRLVSWDFLVWWIAGIAMLYGVGVVVDGVLVVYGIFAGMLLGPQLGAHLQHFENITVLREVARPSSGVTGSVTYSRRFTCHQSATDVAGAAVAVLVVAALTLSPTLTGAAAGSLVLVAKGARLARKAPPPAPAPEAAPDPAPTEE